MEGLTGAMTLEPDRMWHLTDPEGRVVGQHADNPIRALFAVPVKEIDSDALQCLFDAALCHPESTRFESHGYTLALVEVPRG